MAYPPAAELIDEINTDPEGMGYKDTGVLKPYPEVLRLLGMRRTIPNPEPQGQIPRPLEYRAFMLDIGVTELAAFDWQSYKDFQQAIADSDRDALETWIDLAFAKTWIDGPKRTALLADWVNGTIDDPSWTATVSAPSRFQELWGSQGYDNLDLMYMETIFG